MKAYMGRCIDKPRNPRDCQQPPELGETPWRGQILLPASEGTNPAADTYPSDFGPPDWDTVSNC